MPAVCELCRHPRRREIDEMLAQERSVALIATAFQVTESQLRHHREKHLRNVLSKSGGMDPISLVRDLDHAREVSLTLIEWAGEHEKWELLLKGVRELRETVMAEAKLTGAGQVDPRHLLPEWQRMREALVKLAEKHPEVGTDLYKLIEGG